MHGEIRKLTSVALLLTASSLAAQDTPPAVLISGASAGLYFGQPSSYNGPVLTARYGRQFNKYLVFGVRGEFRDDDPSGGRAQSLGLGPELMCLAPSLGVQLYAVGGVLLEAVHVGNRPSMFAPDVESGLHLRPLIGAGMGVRTGGADILFEATYAVTGSTSYTMLQFGVASQSGTHNVASAPAAYIQTNTLAPLTEDYQSEEDYRGYTLAVDIPARTPLGEAIRASVGIDFLDFEFSTGALELLVGTVAPVFRTQRNVFSVSLIPQLGGILFFEPSGTPPYPLGMVTVEAQLRYRGIGIFAGVGGALTYGPAGFLPAVPLRLGLVVGL
jgi:hypothetical protein